MCEILVKAIDHVHPDPVKDRAGAYKRHMPVVVFEDGHEWGKEEGPPKFYIVKIPGVKAATMKKYCMEQYVGTGDKREVYRRREWQIDETLLNPTQLSDVQQNKGLTLTSQQAADDIMSKIGG